MEEKRSLAMHYFILTYITTILLTRPSLNIQKISKIIWLIPLVVWILSFLINIIKKDRFTMIWFERSKKVNAYFLILGIVMIIVNFSSLNMFYSIYSSLFSVALLAMMFNVIGPLLIKVNNCPKYKETITIQLLAVLCIAILGQIIFKSWKWDSTNRFSGGVNPNMMSLISLFCFIWFFDFKIDNENSFYSKIGIIMSIVILLWTLSRGRIISFFFLILYLFVTFFFVLINPKLKYRFNKKKALLRGIWGVVLLIFSVVGIYVILNNQVIIDRLSTPITTRKNAWLILDKGFKDNVLFGSFGWWNANKVIKVIRQYSNVKMASSAHNFYLRVLSETGVIGLSVLMIFPLTLFMKSLWRAMVNKDVDKKKRKKLLLYSGAILAFFISQFVEDQYMNGIGDFQTGLFAWILTLDYYYLIDEDLNVIKNDPF